MSTPFFFDSSDKKIENKMLNLNEDNNKTSLKNYASALSQNYKNFKNQITGFIPIKINELKNEYFFDTFSQNITDFSNEVFYYYKSKRNCEMNKNKMKELKEMFFENLSSCHQVSFVNSKIISKDPLDRLLFKFTKWEIYEQKFSDDTLVKDSNDTIAQFIKPSQEKDLNDKLDFINQKYSQLNEKVIDEDHENLLKEHYELGIIRNFGCDEFSYKKTVIVKDINDSFFKIFSKGNPSIILDMCKPDTVPKDFNEKINEFKEKGKIVIALCGKMVKMNYLQSQLIERSKCERNMTFLGLVIVERNKWNSRGLL